MKIEEAIKILDWENSQFPYSANPEFTEALQLGIEAGDREEYNRIHHLFPIVGLLPSETKE